MFTIPALILALIFLAVIVFRLVDGVAQAGDAHEALDVEAELARLDVLARRRALLIREIKEAELDHEMGKIDDADHSRIKRRLQREWLRVDDELRAIGGSNDVYREQVEVELSARLKRLEESDARRRPERALCAACGAANALSARACESCDALLLGGRAPIPSVTPTLAQER